MMLEISDFFGISPDVPAFKVHAFTSEFKFWIEVNDISSKNFNSNFAWCFDLHWLTNFAKKKKQCFIGGFSLV